MGWAPAHPRDAEVPGLGLRSGTAPGARAELAAPAPGNQPGLCAEAWGAGLSPHPPHLTAGQGPGSRCCAEHRASAAHPPAPVHRDQGVTLGLGRESGI